MAEKDGKDAPKKPRHKATYAQDKKNGGYLVRVIGPDAEKFVGREIPVTNKDGETNIEKVVRLIWKGVDTGIPAKDGKPEIKGTGQPAALYEMAKREKQKKDVEF